MTPFARLSCAGASPVENGRMRVLSAAVAALALVACGDDETSPHAQTKKDAGAETPCGATEVRMGDGSCAAVGVPAEACAPGFTADGDAGCVATLPALPCEPGSMAVPGESACRPVADCGDAPWGAASEGATLFVDAAFGGTPDGSEAKPYPSIQQAIDGAADGAVIAVAAGTYTGEIVIDHPVAVRGRCPSLVAVAPKGSTQSAVLVWSAANGAELSGVAVTSDAIGVAVSGALDVKLSKLWIHDTKGRGLVVQDSLGDATVTLDSSLVEAVGNVGALVAGAALSIDASVVRGVTTDAGGGYGYGVSALVDPNTERPSTLALRGSLLHELHGVALIVSGSDATVEASVVRDVAPGANGVAAGVDVIGDAPTMRTASLAMKTTVVERTGDVGVATSGGTTTVETSTIGPLNGGTAATGRGGVIAFGLAGLPASLTVRSSRIQDVPEAGVGSSGGTLVADHLLVRRAARSAQGVRGVGAFAQDAADSPAGPATITASLFEDSGTAGIAVLGAVGTLEDVTTRQPPGTAGRGVLVQYDPVTLVRAQATVRRAHVEGAAGFGVAVMSASASLEDVDIRDTATDPGGLFGDGIALVTLQAGPADATVTRAHVERSARASLASFGSGVVLDRSTLLCGAIDLAAQPVGPIAPTFQDAGGNTCGCGEKLGACKLLAAELAPPEPLP